MNSDLERVTINGRVFQRISLDEGIYFAPVANDDREEDRLTAQHDLISRLLGDSLVSNRIRLRSPSKVLDCGYGGGDWSVQFAEEYEDCEVTGIDIFPMLVADQPENLTLYGYNLNDRLNDTEIFQLRAFDLIHSRFVAPGIRRRRWSSYLREIRLLLRSGGWLQVIEYHLHIQSDSGRLTDQSAVYRWWQGYVSAMSGLDRDPRIGQRLESLLEAERFRDVHVEYKMLPIGAWSADPVQASIGEEAVAMVGDLLESMGLWPFTTRLGWTAAQFDTLIQQIRSELQDRELKLYLPVYIASARR